MRPSHFTRLLAAIIVLLATSQFALAQSARGRAGRHGKIDRALREAIASSSKPQHVIIRTKPGSRADIRKALEAHGDLVSGEAADLNAIVADVHADDIAALADSQAVLGVSFNAIVRADGAPSAKSSKSSSARTKAKAKQAEAAAKKAERLNRKVAQQANAALAKASGENLRATLGIDGAETGAGVVVAVVDSGIAPLADFGHRIVAFFDCMGTRCVPSVPYDDYGHGTHVSGLVAGSRTGVATGALLIGLKVLDQNGEGRTSDVLNALEWVRRYKDAYGIQVVNLSLGHPIYEKAETDPLVISVQQTTRAGLKVLVAAGNFGLNKKTNEPGYAGITSPGNAPNATTVGALETFNTVTRQDDRVARYSSRGPTWYDAFLKPDLVAPGDALEAPLPMSSTLKKLYEERGGKGVEKYVKLSGTSMATAVASGVVAAVLQANADLLHTDVLASAYGLSFPVSHLSNSAVKGILQYTAIPVYDENGQIYDPLTQGAGGINAGGAISVAANVDASKQAPDYWLSGWVSADALGQTTIGGQPYNWTQNIFWGDNIVWGSGLVTRSQMAWDDNIVWGSSFDWDNIVWGSSFDSDNIVWGSLFDSDNIVWGSNIDDDNIVWGSDFGFDNIVWGSNFDDNIVWGSAADWADNIVWGSKLIGMDLGDDNIVWGSNNPNDDNIVWGSNDDNIVWGSLNDDNIVWGSLFDDNIVWGSSNDDDNVVWGSGDDDNVVWGSSTF